MSVAEPPHPVILSNLGRKLCPEPLRIFNYAHPECSTTLLVATMIEGDGAKSTYLLIRSMLKMIMSMVSRI